MRKLWVVIIIVLIVLATTVRVDFPVRGKLIEYVSAPGEIEPLSNVEISAKVSARVVALPHDEGATVTKGDPNASPPVLPSVLLKLDSKDWESQLVSAQANRDAQAAQSEVEQARIASQKATLKNLATREQTPMAFNQVPDFLKNTAGASSVAK